MTTKTCNKCGLTKNTIEFYFRRNSCKMCFLISQKSRREKNKQHIKDYGKKYYLKNKEKISIYHAVWSRKNRTKINELNVLRFKNNPVFRIHESVRGMIKQSLRSNKKGLSISKFLGYSFEELKFHIESQFESWMNWQNWGRYNPKTWNDNDPTTWTWQLDHIVPRVFLTYSSMEDENFQKCWSLSNLRPLSAKQNVTEAHRRFNEK